MTLEDIDSRLDELAVEHGADYGLRLEIASECCWSCELRWTAEPHRHDAPDRSTVFYTGGWPTAGVAATHAFTDMLDYLSSAA